jgi:fermentation-respiration switch protein FrsA (DUF1100 family)
MFPVPAYTMHGLSLHPGFVDAAHSLGGSAGGHELVRAARLSGRLMLAATLAAPAALGLASLALVEYVTTQLTGPSPRTDTAYTWTPFETGVAWEDVQIPTQSSVMLHGWLLPQGARSPAVLACGGYRGRRSDLLGIASYLWRRGFAVLLFDYRGHGDHAGEPVTLGYRELEDARAALAFLRQRLPGSPLGVIGYSMGAAIAIMVAAREPDVRAVVADSPFTSQREIVAWHARRKLGPLTEPVLALVDRQLYKRYGYRFRDVEPLRDVVHLAPRPLLVIHGSHDTVIPLEHAQRLYAAAGEPKELWITDTIHCGAYFQDRPGYCARVAAFLERALGGATQDTTPATMPAA